MIEIRPLDSLTTPRECALKLLEESSEACEALKEYDKVQNWNTYQEALMLLNVCVIACRHSARLGLIGRGLCKSTI